MEFGIIGLPKSGKTTVFNALSRGSAEIAPSPALASKPNLGVAKVPDARLVSLRDMFNPQRMVNAEVRYVDFPRGSEDISRTRGISGEYLNLLENTDALLHVVRAFEDPSVPHVEGSVDPHRDLVAMDLEMAFADLAILERRVERLQNELKGARAAEREARAQEHALLDRIRAGLEQEMPIREQSITPEEAKVLENFQFLSAKPLLIAWNIGEEDAGSVQELSEELRSRYSRPGVEVIVLCGKLEMDLAGMGEEEEEEFRSAMGIGESGLNQSIRKSYDILDLVSFFTVGPREVRAWTLERDTQAVKAAGKIHTDMERGFIRAEVVSFEDLSKCGNLAESKKRGLLRLEGKTYQVQDGDVITFLFNV